MKQSVGPSRTNTFFFGKIRRDKVKNDDIRERIGVALIVQKTVEIKLRWFEHAERRHVDFVVRRVDQMKSSLIIKGRGRLKKTIEIDLEYELDRKIVYDITL